MYCVAAKFTTSEQKASEGGRTPVIAAEVSRFARNTVEFRLFLPHGRASSSVAVLRLSALTEFADSALGVGVIDTHAFANLRLPIEQVLRDERCWCRRIGAE